MDLDRGRVDVCPRCQESTIDPARTARAFLTFRDDCRLPGGSVVGVALLGAMATPDGLWRVEVHRERGLDFYRILRRADDGQYRLWVHDEQPADRLVIAAVRRILADEGVDLADLEPVDE